MLNPAVTIKNPSAMSYQAIQQQFRQCLLVMNNLSQEVFTVSQFTVDGYSRLTITLLHDRRCDALHQKGHAVRYALGTEHQGRWENTNSCKITAESPGRYVNHENTTRPYYRSPIGLSGKNRRYSPVGI